MMFDPDDTPGGSRRNVFKNYIRWAVRELDLTPPDVARLALYSPSAIHNYLDGRRVPSLNFLLDLLDKIPLADPTFKQIAPLLGIDRSRTVSPFRYRRRPLPEYLAVVRIAARRTRDQFAAKLGVPTQEVYDAEHGIIPNRDYLLRVARSFLPSDITLDDVIAVFPVLRPTAYEIEVQRSLEKIRLHPPADAQRLRLENNLASKLIPEAKRIATAAAWKINRPEYAEEAWGEGIALAIMHQDPRRGLFFSYLKARIRGLVHDLARGNLQTGTATILRDYGGVVREAEDSLYSRLGRVPTEEEIAAYSDIRPRLVGEVRRARAACSHTDIDSLDFLLCHAVDIGSSSEPIRVNSYEERLQRMPEDWREIIFLHFHDKLSIIEIASPTNLPEETVTATLDLALSTLRGESTPG